MRPIPYARPDVTTEDIAAVNAVLQDDFLTTGPRIPAFEQAFATYIGAPYAVAVSSGTAALHLCALALGVKEGQRWLVPSLSFVASANCITYAGGSVEFIDIHPANYLLSLDRIEDKLSQSPDGTYHGIVAVDFAGYPVLMHHIRQIADTHHLSIIEDSCHAPGAWFRDAQGKKHRCGDGTLADLAIFSFHPTKHVTTGEGGMITTANEQLYRKLLTLRNHGLTRDRAELKEDHGGWYYEMQELGFNYRMSDIHAALGLSQLQRVDVNLQRRRTLAARYDEALADTPVRPAPRHQGHAYHLYVIETPQRKALYEFLRQQQVFSQVHYIPIHLQPYYQEKGWKSGMLPHVERYYQLCLSLPMFPGLTDDEQEFVIGHIRRFFRQSGKKVR